MKNYTTVHQMNETVKGAIIDYLIFEDATSNNYPFKKRLEEITDDEMKKIIEICDGQDDTETIHYAIDRVVG